MRNLKGSYERSGVFTKVVLLLVITLFFTLLLLPIIALLSYLHLAEVEMLKISQLLLSIGVIVLPPFVLAYLIVLNPLTFLHLERNNINWLDVLFVVLFMILIIPFINLLGDLNHHLVLPKVYAGLETLMKDSEEQAAQLTEKFLNVHTIQGLFYNIFLIGVIPAIGEELYFRGALQGIIYQRNGIVKSIWITAIIFSTIHFQFYGFLPRMLMGAFFGYLVFWSENILLPIVGHFTNNVIAVIFYHFKLNGHKLPDIDVIGFGNTLWIGLLSGVIALFGFLWLKSHFITQKGKIINT